MINLPNFQISLDKKTDLELKIAEAHRLTEEAFRRSDKNFNSQDVAKMIYNTYRGVILKMLKANGYINSEEIWERINNESPLYSFRNIFEDVILHIYSEYRD